MTCRRHVLGLAAGALLVPVASFAQQPGKVWRVGFLVPRGRPASLDADFLGAFPHGMREHGYVEGRNLVVEWRFGDSRHERLPALAAELVRMKVDVIVTTGTPATRAARQATASIPIVMATVDDPVGNKHVASLARPGGNVTGLANFSGDVLPKHLELLRTVLPALSRVGVLANRANPAHARMRELLEATALRAGVAILPAEISNAQQIETAFSMLAGLNAGAVIVLQDGFLGDLTPPIAEQAMKHGLPCISTRSGTAESGFLMSYGQNLGDNYRRAAAYVDKIFKGTKPAELPVEQPTKLTLIINRKTARALGVAIPPELLLRADTVIE